MAYLMRFLSRMDSSMSIQGRWSRKSFSTDITDMRFLSCKTWQTISFIVLISPPVSVEIVGENITRMSPQVSLQERWSIEWFPTIRTGKHGSLTSFHDRLQVVNWTIVRSHRRCWCRSRWQGEVEGRVWRQNHVERNHFCEVSDIKVLINLPWSVEEWSIDSWRWWLWL